MDKLWGFAIVFAVIAGAIHMYRDWKFSKTPEGIRQQQREDAGYY